MTATLPHDTKTEHRREYGSPAPTRWSGVARAVPAIGLAGVCAAAAFTELSAEEGTIYCPYRIVTGGWCPGCGCTRALKALVRGNVGDSLAMNPWTAVLFVQAVVVSIALLVMPARTVSWVREYKVPLAAVNVIAALSFWIVRLSTGTIPLPFNM